MSNSTAKNTADVHLLSAIRQLRRLLPKYGLDSEEANQVRWAISMLEGVRNVVKELS